MADFPDFKNPHLTQEQLYEHLLTLIDVNAVQDYMFVLCTYSELKQGMTEQQAVSYHKENIIKWLNATGQVYPVWLETAVLSYQL